MKGNWVRLLTALMLALMLAVTPAVLAEGDPPAGDTVPVGEGDDLPTEEESPDPTTPPAGDTTPTSTGGAVAQDVTRNMKASVSGGNKGNLVDRKNSTSWTAQEPGAKIRLQGGEGKVLSNMVIEWTKAPRQYVITQYDSGGQTLATQTQDDFIKALQVVYPLNERTYRILIEVGNGESISELYVYGEGELPATVHQWEAQPTEVDLLVIAARAGDEFLYMGGMLPYYNRVRGLKTQVVYMIDSGRQTQDEALAALWSAGIRSYPEFGPMASKSSISLNDALSTWGEDNIVKALVEQIRKYKPKVIVTNDISGEKNDGARMAVSHCLERAVTEAADSSKYADSYELYGTWETQKLYRHLGTENEITLDWSVADEALGGQTPMAVAKSAYDQYATLKAATPFTEGGELDNQKFSLVYTTAGQDTAGNDLFENIAGVSSGIFDPEDEDVDWGDEDPDEDALNDLNEEDLLAAQGALTPPTATATPEPTSTPEPTATPVPQGLRIRENLEPLKIFGIVVAILIVLVGIAAVVRYVLLSRGIQLKLPALKLGRSKKKKKTTKKSSSGRKTTGTKKKSTGAKKTTTKRPPDEETY